MEAWSRCVKQMRSYHEVGHGTNRGGGVRKEEMVSECKQDLARKWKRKTSVSWMESIVFTMTIMS